MVGPGLVLSPAQRVLVEKSLVVQQARQDKAIAQRTIDDAAQRHISATKARCQALALHNAKDARDRDRRLMIRHVGEELARVAQQEKLVVSKAANNLKHKSQRSSTSGARAPNNGWCKNGDGNYPNRNDDENDRSDDGYDEERFGPVRRPPRNRPPNLWVSVFDQELAEVKKAQDETKRKRLAAAADFRRQLAQQEGEKLATKIAEREVNDQFARAQAQQIAAWQAAEKEKQKQQHDAMVAESKRCEEEMHVILEQQKAAQQKKVRNELRTIARYQALMEQEKCQQAASKERQKQEMILVKQANASQLALKREEKLREQEEEVRLQMEYKRRLDMQEQARQQELQAVLAKQSQKVKLALLNVKTAEEKAREDEIRAMVVQKQVQEREEQERLRRELKHQEITRIQLQALAQQKEERRKQYQHLQDEEHNYARACKQDFVQWQQNEQNTKRQVKERNHAYQQQVLQQMSADASRKANEDKYGMTRVEMALNASILKIAGINDIPHDAPSR